MEKKKLWLANWIIMWYEELFSESDEKEIKIMRCFLLLNLVAWAVIFVMIFKHL